MMTDAEIRALVEALMQEHMTHQAPPPEDTRMRDIPRMLAHGAAFGASDEAEEMAGGMPREQIRERLDQYRRDRPWEAAAVELLGAAVPSVVATLATGGGGAPGVLANAARIVGGGAAAGGLYGFNTGEGGFENRLSRVPEGAAWGAAGGLGGAALGGVAGRLVDVAARTLGPRATRTVERIILETAEKQGMTVDDVAEMVANGQLLAENETMATLARALRAQSTGAEVTLRQAFEGRPERLRQETMEYLQSRMAPGDDPNALRAQYAMTDARKAETSADYERAYGAMPQVPQEISDAMAEALKREPSAGKIASRMYRHETGRNPYYQVGEDGAVSFAETPDLRSAEIMRRALSDSSNVEYQKGSGEVGRTLKGVERGLRGALDRAAPELYAARSKWAAIEAAADAFEAGRTALGKSPDEVALLWEDLRQAGDGPANAFRAGVFSAYKARAATGAGATMPKRLANEEAREGQIIRMVFPEDDLDELLLRANRATGSANAKNRILGGSETAITAGRGQEINGGLLGLAVEGAATGDPSGVLMRAVTQAVKAIKPGLSPKEATRAAQILVETDPEAVRRALGEGGAMNTLSNMLQRTIRGAAPIGGGIGGAAIGDTSGLLGIIGGAPR